MLGSNSYLPKVLELVQQMSLADTAAVVTVIVWRNCGVNNVLVFGTDEYLTVLWTIPPEIK